MLLQRKFVAPANEAAGGGQHQHGATAHQQQCDLCACHISIGSAHSARSRHWRSSSRPQSALRRGATAAGVGCFCPRPRTRNHGKACAIPLLTRRQSVHKHMCSSWLGGLWLQDVGRFQSMRGLPWRRLTWALLCSAAGFWTGDSWPAQLGWLSFSGRCAAGRSRLAAGGWQSLRVIQQT